MLSLSTTWPLLYDVLVWHDVSPEDAGLTIRSQNMLCIYLVRRIHKISSVVLTLLRPERDVAENKLFTAWTPRIVPVPTPHLLQWFGPLILS